MSKPVENGNMKLVGLIEALKQAFISNTHKPVNKLQQLVALSAMNSQSGDYSLTPLVHLAAARALDRLSETELALLEAEVEGLEAELKKLGEL